MAKTEFHIKDLNELPNAAAWLLETAGDIKLFAFYGEMGAGKTTMIQEVCRQLGVIQDVTSPTFALVNEYFTGKNQTIYHFDFYRMGEPEEALDIGFEDYVSSGNLCFMEWPEKIGSYLPDECLKIRIKVEANGSRNIKLEFPR